MPTTRTNRITLNLDKVEFASFPQRIGARICDSILVTSLFVAFVYLNGEHIVFDSKNLDPSLGIGNLIWYLPLFAFAYEVPLLASRGLTIGKRVFGICVVRTDGLIGIGLDRAIVRFLVPQLLGIIPALGVFAQLTAQIWFFFDPNRQNLADKAAKTFVIRIPNREQIVDEHTTLEEHFDDDTDSKHI